MNRTVIAPLSSAIIALLLAGVVVVGVDRGTRGLRPGEARLVVSRGVVEVSIGGAPYVQASRDRVLRRDDRVRVVKGSAILELSRSSMAELREGSTVTVSGDSDPGLILNTGDLLVQAPRNTVKVDGGNALVSVAGAAKLRRSSSLVAGVYEGSVLLQSEGQTLGIPRYRQAVAAGTGLLPATPRPLDLRASDEWDRRMLGDVIALSEQLEIFGRGFEAQLPAAAQMSPEFFKAVLPELASEPITPQLLIGRSPGENLIGLVLVGLDRGDFATRVSSIFGFRADGASWGLVAADRGLNPNPILSGLESAAGRAVRESATASGGGGGLALGRRGRTEDLLAAGGTSPTAPGGGAPKGNPGGASPPPKPGSPGSPGSPSPSPPNPPPSDRVTVPPTGTVLDSLLSPITGPVADLLNGLLDSLLGEPNSSAVPTRNSAEVAPAPAAPLPSAPAPTTTTAPAPSASTGLLGGVTTAVGGLLGG